jgi:NTP pyrophosphatase (non-canonical NTP hydrolase)
MEISDGRSTLEDLKNWVREFCEERSWDPYHGPKDLAIGLVTEASELLELFRFVNEKESLAMLEDPEAREKIADELADSIYFVLRFAQMYGFDISQSVKAKIAKNAIKYPAK